MQVDTRLAPTLSRVRTLMAVVDLAVLALGAAIVIPLVRSTLQPLRVMVDAAGRLAAGDLRYRVAAPSRRDEAGEIAVAFNNMADRVQATFESQQQFLADASHELQTPLAAMRGTVEVLLRGALGDADPKVSHSLLRNMRVELMRLSHLVDGLLILARVEGRMPLRREMVALAPLLDEVLIDIKPLATDREISAALSASTVVAGDRDRLKQVFLNVAHNALKYTPAGGRVEIALVALPDHAVVRISEPGPGIPAHELSFIFKRFFRSETNGHDRTGTGLGLAISRAIVEAHGGEIGIISRPNEGTTITITLPVWKGVPNS